MLSWICCTRTGILEPSQFDDRPAACRNGYGVAGKLAALAFSQMYLLRNKEGSMEEDKVDVSGHTEGAKSAADTLTGTGLAGIAWIAYSVFGKPWLARHDVNLTGEQEAGISFALTASLTGISSYIHGFLRGKKN